MQFVFACPPMMMPVMTVCALIELKYKIATRATITKLFILIQETKAASFAFGVAKIKRKNFSDA
jgi:hypothetical protein